MGRGHLIKQYRESGEVRLTGEQTSNCADALYERGWKFRRKIFLKKKLTTGCFQVENHINWFNPDIKNPSLFNL